MPRGVPTGPERVTNHKYLPRWDLLGKTYNAWRAASQFESGDSPGISLLRRVREVSVTVSLNNFVEI